VRGLLVALAGTVLWLPSHLFSQSYGERDTDFRVSLSHRSEPPAGLEATIVTTNIYPCEGYTIRSGVTWEKDTISLHLFGFVRPSPCIQSGSEATGTAFVGTIRDSTFFFRITYRGESDLHKVVVRKTRLSVTPIRSAFTELRGF